MTVIELIIRYVRGHQPWPLQNNNRLFGVVLATSFVTLAVTWFFGGLQWLGTSLMFFFSSLAAVVALMGIPAVSGKATGACWELPIWKPSPAFRFPISAALYSERVYVASPLWRGCTRLRNYPYRWFDRTDLRMAENWLTISKIGSDQQEMLLPILDEDGKRLEGHRSGRVYFGNTITFRRGVIGTERCEFDAYRGMMEYLTKSVSGKSGEYLYRQYFQLLPPDALLMKGIYAIQPKEIICESRFSIP